VAAATVRGSALVGAVDVVGDNTGRVGALSYRVPDGMAVHVGDAVEVPIGARTATGVVVGPAADPRRATRAILTVYGPRAGGEELALLDVLARRYLCRPADLTGRLAPRTRRGNPPLDLGGGPTLAVAGPVPGLERIPAESSRRLLCCAPSVELADVAAVEAARVARHGQVLVLCATVEEAEAVSTRFRSGAARLDHHPRRDELSAWSGFVAGTVAVGIAPRRAALWSAEHLAGIVVVDEAHPGHREQSGIRTHAADLAAVRSAHQDLALSLIGRFPSPSALGAGVKLYEVGGPDEWPRLTLVDRQASPPGDRALPDGLAARMRAAAARGITPVVVAENRPARRLCVRCHTRIVCSRCGQDGCADHRPADPCPSCLDPRSIVVGWPAERLRARFGDHVRVASYADLAHLSDAGCVVIMNIDPALGRAGGPPGAYAADLLVAAARAAGPGGEVVTTTGQAQHPLLGALFERRSLKAAARWAWETAHAVGLPPFRHLIRIVSTFAPPTQGWPGVTFGARPVRDGHELVVLCGDAGLDRLKDRIDGLRNRGRLYVEVTAGPHPARGEPGSRELDS